MLVGIGEGGYGPAAPTILADLFPLAIRGRILSVFCAAIPVGGALGYVLGGLINAISDGAGPFTSSRRPGFFSGCSVSRSAIRAARHPAEEQAAPDLA